MKFFFLIVISFFVLGCASEKPKGKTEAEVLYKEAKNLMKDERYLLATEKLNQLKNQYPYSFYATPAELMQADIFYLQENYVEAAAAYLLFRDFHPKHEKISYVVYRIAESYYKQLPETDDRDLEAAHEAIKYYGELLSKYGDTKHVKDARKKMNECKKRLSNYEQYVADFYYKTEVYSAAKWRYEYILDNFKNNKLRSHSMKRIVLSSYYLKEFDSCIELSSRFANDLNKSDKKEVTEFTRYCKNKIK